MGLFDGLLGLKRIEDRLSRMEERLGAVEELLEDEYKPSEEFKKDILEFLSEPRTTAEIANRLGKSRGWTSIILNILEKKGRVKESGRRGRELLYERV